MGRGMENLCHGWQRKQPLFFFLIKKQKKAFSRLFLWLGLAQGFAEGGEREREKVG